MTKEFYMTKNHSKIKLHDIIKFYMTNIYQKINYMTK